MSLTPEELREKLLVDLSAQCPFWSSERWDVFLRMNAEDQKDVLRAYQLGETPASPTFLSIASTILQDFLGAVSVVTTVAAGVTGVASATLAIKALLKS